MGNSVAFELLYNVGAELTDNVQTGVRDDLKKIADYLGGVSIGAIFYSSDIRDIGIIQLLVNMSDGSKRKELEELVLKYLERRWKILVA